MVSATIKGVLKKNTVQRILSGAFWSLFGTAVGKFFILLSGIFCARILGDTLYGELGIVRSTIAMFIVIGSAGIGVTASKYISEYRATEKNKEIASIISLTRLFSLCFGALIVIVVFFSAGIIATDTLDAPELEFDLKCGAVLLFFSIFNAYQNGVLSGFENFKAIGLNTLYAGVIEFGLIVGGAYYGQVSGAIIGYGISFIILSLLNKHSISKTLESNGITIHGNHFMNEHKMIISRFAIPAALNSLIVVAAFWCLKTMLVRMTNFAQLGIYEAADQWKVIMLYIPSALSSILLPILSNTSGKGASVKRLLKYNIMVNMIISGIIAIIVIIFSGTIMGFYGAGFEQPDTLIVLAASTIFTTVALVTTTAMTSLAKVWLSFLFQTLWGATMLVSAYILLSKGFGASGIAWAILIAYFILSLTQTIYYFSHGAKE